MKKHTFGLLTVVAAGVIGGCVGAGASHIGTAHAAEGAQAVTVFVDATLGFRKDHLARQLTKSHAAYAAKGYAFADMEAFTENGDLQGFFVTYARN